MSKQVMKFIEEMRKVTGESFLYTVDTWAMNHRDDIYTRYKLTSNLKGFDYIEKETLEELIETFDLVRNKVSLLMQTNELTKKIDIKLLK